LFKQLALAAANPHEFIFLAACASARLAAMLLLLSGAAVVQGISGSSFISWLRMDDNSSRRFASTSG
jgi:hypothetical protein